MASKLANLVLAGFLALTGKAIAQDQTVNWNDLRKSDFLKKEVRIINSYPICTFSEFKDKEKQKRGFRVYQFRNSNKDLVELYDLERDGYLGDAENSDNDNTIDGIVVSRFNPKDCFIRKEARREGKEGQELYREATEMYEDIVGRKIHKNKFNISVLY